MGTTHPLRNTQINRQLFFLHKNKSIIFHNIVIFFQSLPRTLKPFRGIIYIYHKYCTHHKNQRSIDWMRHARSVWSQAKVQSKCAKPQPGNFLYTWRRCTHILFNFNSEIKKFHPSRYLCYLPTIIIFIYLFIWSSVVGVTRAQSYVFIYTCVSFLEFYC